MGVSTKISSFSVSVVSKESCDLFPNAGFSIFRGKNSRGLLTEYKRVVRIHRRCNAIGVGEGKRGRLGNEPEIERETERERERKI